MTYVYCDNQSSINLSKNIMVHDNSKHVEIGYHYIHDMVQKGVLKLQYVAIDKIVDVLINPPLRVIFEYFMDKLGVFYMEFPCERE